MAVQKFISHDIGRNELVQKVNELVDAVNQLGYAVNVMIATFDQSGVVWGDVPKPDGWKWE